MATEIRVPTLGESVSEATVGRWFKKAGDTVKADEPVLELETDKVTLEVNAPAAGVLAELVVKDGDTVTPGALLGQIEAGGAGAQARGREAAAGQGSGRESLGRRRRAGRQGRKRRRLRQSCGHRPQRSRPPRARPGGTDITVPTLGESVSEATVAKWFKKPGDAVKADEPLLELETDKVTLEVNAPAAGVLAAIGVEAGATVTPGAVLGQIAAANGASPPAASRPPTRLRPRHLPSRPPACRRRPRPPSSRPKTASTRARSRVRASAGRYSRATCSMPSRRRRPPPRDRRRAFRAPCAGSPPGAAGHGRGARGARPHDEAPADDRAPPEGRAEHRRDAHHLQRGGHVGRDGPSGQVQGHLREEARREARLHGPVREGLQSGR